MKVAAILMAIELGVCAVQPALAEQTPRAGSRDSRIRFVWYQKDDVVSVPASYGASTMIEFGDDEKIETLGAGDVPAWSIEPNKKGNVLFVKPIEKNAGGNLNVLTNKRSYVFFLNGEFRPVAQQVYAIKFRYPEEVSDAALMDEARARAAQPNRQGFKAENANSSYAYKGSSANKPLVIYDDGVKTWFRFDPAREVPAIYVVDSERNETLVNYRREGPYIVVDKVNYQWTLRNGTEATCVFNLRLNNVNEPTGLEPYEPQRVGGGTVRKVRGPDAISQ